MSVTSARLSLGFGCVAHTYAHLFQPIFYIAVLALEADLGLSHGETVALIVGGSVLFGLAAPLAGWLGDRWSTTGMMGFFFAGTGAGMVMTGLAGTPFMIALWLAGTGLFASIYHPVGIAWLVRNSASTGMALGINGIFGTAGPALAAVMAGVLIDAQGWRAAFLVPGVVVLATGLLFYAAIWRGQIVDSKSDRRPRPEASRQDRVRAIMVLAVTLICTGLIYQATQPALPKVFSERIAGLASEGVFGVSVLVAVVYLGAGVMQVVGGHLADKFPLKTVYLLAFLLQAPFLMLAGVLGGAGLVAVAVIMVSISAAGLPAENVLVATYAPSRWRGLAFGIKFILALGVGGLGVLMEGMLYDTTGGFLWLFVVLAALALVAVAAGSLLPAEARRAVPAAAE